MLTRTQCFAITINPGDGKEVATAIYYVMAENAVQAIAIVRNKGIDLGTNFNLFIIKEVAGFVAPEVKADSAEAPTNEPAKDSEIELGTVGAVKMHSGHFMLFTVKEEKDILRNVTPDVVEVTGVWSENAALIF